MRLWSLHPQYLDTAGLTACWREGLLAKHVLMGKTKGYIHHPQLQRFRACKNPLQAIDTYLYHVLVESQRRNFKYDTTKITMITENIILQVTDQQLQYEFEHLKKKLAKRNPEQYSKLLLLKETLPHPMFEIIKGEIAEWEIIGEATEVIPIRK